MKLRFVLNLFILLSLSSKVSSQNIGYFQPAPVVKEDETIFEYIDHAYENDIDNIPEHFNAKQKTYLRKKYFDRKISSRQMVKNGTLINSGSLFSYLDSLRSVILSANPQANQTTRFYIVRDLSPNAFTVGDNIVYVHLGLFYRLEHEEELIYILCHEIAHNTLDHSRLSQEKYVDEVKNDSITKEFKRRIMKVYGNVTALNELMLPVLLNSSELSRTYEFQADSLAMIYFNNINLDKRNALNAFKIMENFNHERDTVWIRTKEIVQFESCGHGIDKIQNAYKGSSINRNGLVKNDEYKDLLRSHPFEKDRHDKICSDFQLDCSENNTLDSIQHWKYYAENEMIYNSYVNGNLARTLFYLLQNDSLYVDKNLSADLLPISFAILGLEKTNRREGKWMGWMSDEEDKVYSDFYSYLRKMTPEQCMNTAECYSKNMTQSLHFKYYQAFVLAYNKELENFKIVYEFLMDNDTKYPYFDILEEFYSINKLYYK